MAARGGRSGAAAAVGVSVDVIRRAVNAGDLVASSVTVDGRKIAKPLIERDELVKWVQAGRSA